MVRIVNGNKVMANERGNVCLAVGSTRIAFSALIVPDLLYNLLPIKSVSNEETKAIFQKKLQP